MPLVETLIAGAGVAVGKSLLNIWIENDPASAAAGSIAGLIGEKVKSALKKRDLERQFEKLGDKAAQHLETQLKKEFDGKLDENRLDIVANAAGDTLLEIPITAEIVIARNRDPKELTDYFLQQKSANPGLADPDNPNPPYTREDCDAYRRALFHAAQLIVDLSSQFPGYDQSVDAELLKRVDSISDQVIDGLEKAAGQDAEAFEGDYRNAVVRAFDRLELFGVDLSETNKRYRLSVAYVTLMVERLGQFETGDEPEDDEDAEIRDALPADEALAKFPRLFIRGAAGSGKTTLLQWFAVFAASRQLQGELAALNDSVPFLIKLRHFADSDLPRPEDFVAQASEAIAGAAPKTWAHQKLKSGDALVLIDGLDEMPNERREQVRDWLRDLMGVYPKARYVISSRPYAAEEGWLDADEFDDAELQDMAGWIEKNFGGFSYWDCLGLGTNEGVETSYGVSLDLDSMFGHTNLWQSDPTVGIGEASTRNLRIPRIFSD